MRKIAFVIALGLIFFSNSVSASDSQDYNSAEALINLGLMDSRVDLTQSVTRRDCLSYLCEISGGFYNVPDNSLQNEIPALAGFADIEAYADDYKLIFTSYVKGLLKGRINENGEIVADLDSPASLQEAVIMLNRALFSNSVSEELFESDNWWHDFACERGLLDAETAELTLNRKNTDITLGEFADLLYICMHIPFSTHTYGGEKTERYIDGF